MRKKDITVSFNNLVHSINPLNRVFIQVHGPPDPDCLASAVLLKKLLNSKEIAPSILYSGEISKVELKDLLDFLQAGLVHVDCGLQRSHFRGEDQIILVDCQKGNSNILHLSSNYIACIDHHENLNYGHNDYLYCDIRPDYGACASILYEYANSVDYEIDPPLATLLMYGIRVDTNDLTRSKYLKDSQIYYSLYPRADIDLLNSLCTPVMKPSDLKSIASALSNLVIFDKVVYSYAGLNTPRQLLGEISDKLLTLVGIEFVVVYSKHFDSYAFSVRSKSAGLPAGKIVKRAFASHNGEGGGRDEMAGGIIQQITFSDLATDSSVMKRIIQIFSSTFAYYNFNNFKEEIL